MDSGGSGLMGMMDVGFLGIVDYFLFWVFTFIPAAEAQFLFLSYIVLAVDFIIATTLASAYIRVPCRFTSCFGFSACHVTCTAKSLLLELL